MGPFPPARESGQPKSPRIPRRSRQNVSFLQELSIGAPHSQDTPGRSRVTFDARANFGAFFTSRGYPQLAPLVRVDGSRKLPQMIMFSVSERAPGLSSMDSENFAFYVLEKKVRGIFFCVRFLLRSGLTCAHVHSRAFTCSELFINKHNTLVFPHEST